MAAYHKLLGVGHDEQAVAHPHGRVAAESADRQERRAVLPQAGGVRCCSLTFPAVPGVLTPAQCRQTAQSIADTQESSGAIPWSDGGHTDPWDHVENAMALTAAGLLEPARAAFDWCSSTQRADGSWPIQLRNGVIEDANSDSNFCAYIATGVWHHVLITGDRRFAEDDVAGRQQGRRLRARHAATERRNRLGQKRLRARSRRAADRMREHLPQPAVRAGAGGLLRRAAAGVGGRRRPARPRDRPPSRPVRLPRTGGRWSGTTRCSAVRCAARRRTARIDERWDDFVVPGLGIRCVDDRPWVTGAETCELVMALDAIGQTGRARASSSRPCTTCASRTAPTGPGWCSPTASAGRRSAPRGRAAR